MLWMIILGVHLGSGEPARLLPDPMVAFPSEQKCHEAVEVLTLKAKLPLQCVEIKVLGGVPLEKY